MRTKIYLNKRILFAIKTKAIKTIIKIIAFDLNVCI